MDRVSICPGLAMTVPDFGGCLNVTDIGKKIKQKPRVGANQESEVRSQAHAGGFAPI